MGFGVVQRPQGIELRVDSGMAAMGLIVPPGPRCPL